jgi:thiamine-phosphate pyrophosphorylase
MPKLDSMLRYAITDRARFSAESGQQAEPARQAALLRQAARLAAEGIDFLQLREKDLSAAVLAELARRLIEALHANRENSTNGTLKRPAPRLLINSRADVAIATRADGVHLTSSPNELTPAQVRVLYAAAGLAAPIVSLSCHSLADVARAASSNPDERPTHILFGPVFEKVVAEIAAPEVQASEKSPGNKKISAGTGLDLLHAACQAAAPIPVLALGGITCANTNLCLDTGAAGIAAIRLYCDTENFQKNLAPRLTANRSE